MCGYEMFYFNMQFFLISNEMFRTESILFSHIFIVFSLAVSNYVLVSSTIIPEASAVICRQSLASNMIYGYDSFKTCLSVCFNCLDFPNVLVWMIDNSFILVM